MRWSKSVGKVSLILMLWSKLAMAQSLSDMYRIQEAESTRDRAQIAEEKILQKKKLREGAAAQREAESLAMVNEYLRSTFALNRSLIASSSKLDITRIDIKRLSLLDESPTYINCETTPFSSSFKIDEVNRVIYRLSVVSIGGRDLLTEFRKYETQYAPGMVTWDDERNGRGELRWVDLSPQEEAVNYRGVIGALYYRDASGKIERSLCGKKTLAKLPFSYEQYGKFIVTGSISEETCWIRTPAAHLEFLQGSRYIDFQRGLTEELQRPDAKTLIPAEITFTSSGLPVDVQVDEFEGGQFIQMATKIVASDYVCLPSSLPKENLIKMKTNVRFK